MLPRRAAGALKERTDLVPENLAVLVVRDGATWVPIDGYVLFGKLSRQWSPAD